MAQGDGIAKTPPKALYKAIKLTVRVVRLCASKSSFGHNSR